MDLRLSIINYTRANVSDDLIHFYFPPDEYRDLILANPLPQFHRDSDLASKCLFALRIFLRETTFSWFWRGTDDAIINWDNVPEFMRTLSVRYFARKDPVILGHCISSPAGKGFIQGGSGWLISRRAAEMLEPLWGEWVSGMNWSDDWSFPDYMNRFNLDVWNSTSEFFLGHDIKHGDSAALSSKNYNSLPDCRPFDQLPQKFCRQFTAPLRNVVFFHEQLTPDFNINPTLEKSQLAFAAPSTVHFYMEEADVRLCKQQPIQAQGKDS
jgi:hypothetical protein